jgi:hypothetical protein
MCGDVRARLAHRVGDEPDPHEHGEGLATKAQAECGFEHGRDPEQADEDPRRGVGPEPEPENTTPIACAKRLGGPATGRGGTRSRGAITLVANRPRGLIVGPVRTRAQKP